MRLPPAPLRTTHAPSSPPLGPEALRRRRAAVVGAGLAGLSAARRLAEAGWGVAVFEKSRGPGGRTATRRTEGGRAYDHGAPSFGVRDPRFRALLVEARAAGTVDVAVPRIGEVGARSLLPRPEVGERWMGVPGMSAFAGWLAQGLDVRPGRCVSATRPTRLGAVLTLEDGAQTEPFGAVLVTVPGPQAVPLLSAAPSLEARAAALAYAPCVALMLTLAGPLAHAFDSLRFAEGPLAWAVRGASKPGRGPAETWVLYATAEWSAAHLEQAPEQTSAELLAAFARGAGPLPAVAESLPMRWRYARALAGAEGPRALFDPRSGLGLAGDALAGHRVEDAFLSGLALAEEVLAVAAVSRGSDPRTTRPPGV